jgi:adenylate cyclase, class 2
MDWEVERKFRVAEAELAALRQEVVALGGRLQRVEQTDCYFNHPARDFAASDEALRLRRADNLNFVTYKGPRTDATAKTRQELELPLPPGPEALDRFKELFSILGFTPFSQVRKRRESASVSWHGQTIEVALDDVQGVGTFVELEAISAPGEVEVAQQAIGSLAAHLKLQDGERRSYLELVLEYQS